MRLASQRAQPGERGGAVGRLLSDGPMALLARLLLSLVILLSICNLNCFYEQDHLAKAAQVLALSKQPSLLDFPHVPDYYRKELFSAFYLLATVLYKVTTLSAVQTLNLLSVACGGLFLAIVPSVLRRVFGFPEWLAWLVLLCTPIYLVTFSYGNETALALACAALSAFCLTFDGLAAVLAGAFFFAMASFARSDYVLLGPALSLLCVVHDKGDLSRRRTLLRFLLFSGASAVFAAAYLFIFLRKIPQPDLFGYHTNLKLFSAFIVYGAGLANTVLALVGLGYCILGRQWKLLLALPVLLQALPYLTRLTSPKYIAGSLMVCVVFALAGVQYARRWTGWAPLGLLGIFWFVSISPYGVFGPGKSAWWYLPTDAGPVPTGGYLGFYAQVKKGFYQRRYSLEQQELAEAMRLLRRHAGPADLVQWFNFQPILLWAAENGRWDITPEHISFCDSESLTDEEHRAKFMTRSAYLYPFKLSPAIRTGVEAYLAEGRVAERAAGPGPFPDVIEVGRSVAPGADPELGKRILFLNEYTGGEQAVPRDIFIEEFAGVSWIPRGRFLREAASLPPPVYSDSQWVCFSQRVNNAIYYSMRFPKAYPRGTRTAGGRRLLATIPPSSHHGPSSPMS